MRISRTPHLKNDFFNGKNGSILLIVLFVIVNFLIKGLFLSNNSLGGDEPFSVYHAQMDVFSIIKLLSAGNNPPLYEIILHYWIRIFGISEFSVRFPSLIFSSVTLLYIFKFSVRFFNKRIAVYSCIIFIFSNYHILFAHEARVYSFLGMLSVMAMYYFMIIISFYRNMTYSRARKIFAISILLLLNTLIIYSHYIGFFILITQFLFLFYERTLLKFYWKKILLFVFALILLFSPNIFIFLNRFVDSTTQDTWLSAPGGIEDLYEMIRRFSNAPVVAVAVISVFVIALIKALVKKQESEKISYKFIIFWFVFVFFFMFGISYLYPVFLDRYLMPAAIAFCLLLGIAADSISKNRIMRYIVPVMICLLFIATVKPNITNKRNVREVVALISEIKENNTLVLICPKEFILNYAYYSNNDAFKDYNVNDIYLNIDSTLRLENIYGINHVHDVDLLMWNHIVYLDAAANFAYPENNIEPELNNRYELMNRYHIHEIFNIFEYRKD